MNIGIDLGTSYSLVSRLDERGTPVLMPDTNYQDVLHTPSAVHLSGRNAFVGRMVEHLAEQNPELEVLRYFKRQLGRSEPLSVDEQGARWYVEGISALVLKKLCFDAEAYSSMTVDGAAITVPAHFNDPQRKAVLAAAALADVPVLGLVEEPVAAAMHYGITRQAHRQVILVYDFGGGTFDATALSLDAKGVYVLAKTGLTDLGGKELDEVLGSMILGQFRDALGQEIGLDARTLLELRRVSEELKIELCMPCVEGVERMVLLGGEAVQVSIRVDTFLSAISQHLDRAETTTLQCLEEAGLRAQDVNTMLLVGGSSMTPGIQERWRSILGGPNQQVLHHEPSKAIACGSALHAAQLSGDAVRYELPEEFRGVTGHAVGVRTVDPSGGRVTVETLIKKNMPLPARGRKTFYTTRPDQQRVVLEFVQHRNDGAEPVDLGHLVVGPLPSPRQNYPIEVTVKSCEDGTVAVQAYDAETGVELQQQFGRPVDGDLSHLAAQRALVQSVLINNY